MTFCIGLFLVSIAIAELAGVAWGVLTFGVGLLAIGFLEYLHG